MRAAPRLIAALLCLAPLFAPAQAMAQQTATAAPRAERWHYFVDFRARSSSRIGHTFVVFGRMGARGRVLEAHYAGLYPKDKYEHFLVISALAGPAYAVPAYIGTGKDDRNGQVTAVYRRKLTARSYAHLRATLRRLQAEKPRWHLFFYNCNDFAAQVAQAMRMVTPPTLAPPLLFVNGLAAINGP
jgi:hypothetical protein